MVTNGTILNTTKPVLRWAGGKKWLVSRISEFIPKNYNRYFEPFLGGASVYLNANTTNKKAFLSDVNSELIEFYTQLKENPKAILNELERYKNEEDFFYHIREQVPQVPIERAARFFYLNRTCFNGLYRVNQAGKFNVPYGYRSIKVVEKDALINLSLKLSNAQLKCQDFRKILKVVRRQDFVFLDPPYTVAHNNNGFIEYNQKIFSWDDQERLAEFVEKLIAKKVYFLMTNACHESIKNLYKGIGKHFEIDRFSTISGQSKSRARISELVITNCL